MSADTTQSDPQVRKLINWLFSKKTSPGPTLPPDMILHNLVPRPIYLSSTDDSFLKVIPPFGKLRLKGQELELYSVENWISAGVLKGEAVPDEGTQPMEILALIWASVYIVSGVSYWVSKTYFNGKFIHDDWFTITFLTAVAVSIIYSASDIIRNRRFRGFIQSIKRSFDKIKQSVAHSIGLLLQIAIACAIPSFAILNSPSGDPLIKNISAPIQSENNKINAITLDNAKNITPQDALSDTAKPTPDLYPKNIRKTEDLGKKLQILMIGLLSSLPALLFFLFDRQRLSTLKEEFYRATVLLVPSIHTVRDANSVYGLRADSLIGSVDSPDKTTKFLHRNRSIIFVTTILVTVGWTITFANQPIPMNAPYIAYVTPAEEILVFAFLGAYTFGVSLLFRRYARSDIKPSAYAHFTVRTIMSITIAWVVSILFDGLPKHQVLACAFFIGFFPSTGLRAIAELVGKILSKPENNTITEKYPLSLLDGVNIYHRTRLIDEGIENMETLAHADLISLMLQTRIPLSTLIDWIDQSILFLHVSKGSGDNADILTLRSYGIRTATDLLQACELTKTEKEKQNFYAILDNDQQKNRIKTIINTLLDDDWLENIKTWHYNTSQLPTLPLRHPMELYNPESERSKPNTSIPQNSVIA